jgi:uncharacterized protein
MEVHMPDQNPFIWHEWVTADQLTSGAFFRQLFGWARKEVDARPFGTYALFQVNGQDVAGMMTQNPIRRARGRFGTPILR